MNSFRNKLVGPMSAVILVALGLMLAFEIFTWTRPSTASEAGGGELLVNIGSQATAVLVDANGKPIGQTSEASVIRIPKLEPGDYSLVLRGLSQGESRFVIQALREGKTAFRYEGTANITPQTDWLVQLHVEVLNGLAQDIRVISSPDSSGKGRSGEAAEGTASSPVDTIKSSLGRVFNQATSYMENQWITIGSMVFLGLVLLVIWKKR